MPLVPLIHTGQGAFSFQQKGNSLKYAVIGGVAILLFLFRNKIMYFLRGGQVGNRYRNLDPQMPGVPLQGSIGLPQPGDGGFSGQSGSVVPPAAIGKLPQVGVNLFGSGQNGYVPFDGGAPKTMGGMALNTIPNFKAFGLFGKGISLK